jgi:agmatine/peptidylarginine deiminase
MRSHRYKLYESNVKQDLAECGIKTVPFPYAYDQCEEMEESRFRQQYPEADNQNSALGYYNNYLKIGNAIIYPMFFIDRDDRCVDALLDVFPGANCIGIDCRRLSMLGGLIHCVTWSDED